VNGASKKAAKPTLSEIQQIADIKKRRQAKHVLDRVRQEGHSRTTTLKKTCAMLQQPWTASEPQSGLIYISFDDNNAAVNGAATNLSLNQVKQNEVADNDDKAKKDKKKTKKDGEGDNENEDGSHNNIMEEQDEFSDVAFAEEQEYAGNDNDDDFGGAGYDDDE